MMPSQTVPRSALPLLFGTAIAAFTASAFAIDFGGADDITTVTARASSEYVRLRQADGTYASETYAFGKGGIWPGARKDASIDYLSFLDVAHVIANPLAGQHYFPSADPAKTKLLIMVYWGTTRQVIGPATPELRRMQALINTKMLGYESWYNKFALADTRLTAFDQNKKDLYVEIEDDRYFVVLMAYDFQLMWKEKKHRFLWETRFSLRQMHHDFDKDLPSMALYASRYFGQDSNGLVRKPIPMGRVEVGEPTSLGDVPDK
jgi:hypothetical protein